jgi:thiol:disulfide interchange protein
MDDVVWLVWRLVPDWLADRLDDLFHAPFWTALAGVVILSLCAAAFSSLPAAARDRVKLVVMLAALAIAALELVGPLERTFPHG